MARALFVVVLWLSLLPLRAAAGAMPPPSPPVPLPSFVVTGRAVAEDVHLSIACARTDLTNDSSLCRVVVRARLRALDAVSIQVPPAPAITLVEGEPVTDFVTLEADRSISITLTFERALSVGFVDREAPWVISAPRARHPLLGESTSSHRTGDGARGELFGGQDVAITGAIHVQVDPGAIGVSIGGRSISASTDVVDAHGTIALDLDVDDAPAPLLQNGGPYVGLGLWGPLEGDEGRFELRVGYELALADWVIGSVTFETDFDAIAESILIEVATPELVIIVPSISGGVGVVFRQLGNRTADAALRLALGYQYFAFGAYVSFDYWPDISDWTIAAGGRLSI